jgi:hypothetical protein
VAPAPRPPPYSSICDTTAAQERKFQAVDGGYCRIW